MERFKLGNKYFGRFICAHDSTVTVLIVKRTAKTVVVQELIGPSQDLGARHRKKLKENTHPDGGHELIEYGTVLITAKNEIPN